MATATISRRNAGRMPVAPARKKGTWKMAYADFLTALMAFFLVMWMISGTSAEDRTELAQYFNSNHATTTTTTTLQAQPANKAPAILAALTADPVLADAHQNIEITTSDTIVRIDLHDAAGRSLFNTGQGALNEDGRKLTHAAGQALSVFAHPISIEGHTDAFAGQSANFSNWDLSSSRANDARRALVSAGVAPTRIKAVTGLADTLPLKAGQPHLSANRRVSILVHTGG